MAAFPFVQSIVMHDDSCQIQFGDGDTYIYESSDDVLDTYVGNTQMLSITITAVNITSGYLDLNDGVDIRDTGVKRIYLDDTYSAVKIGKNAGNDSMTGYYNTLLGYQAGQDLTSGAYNMLIGFQAGYNITEGLRNVAIGSTTLQQVTDGDNNLAIGNSALQVNTGSNNVALGMQAGLYSISGGVNTFIGTDAGRGDGITAPTGSNNTFIGYRTGFGYTAGVYNIGIGTEALRSVADKGYNIAIGYNAGYYTIGSNNVFMGVAAGKGVSTTSTGDNNTFIGYASGLVYTTASRNLGIGHETFLDLTEGFDNVAIAYRALYNLTTGDYNVGIGRSTFEELITGNNNIAIGSYAGRFSNGSQTNNLFIGYFAGVGVTGVSSGAENVFIGNSSGEGYTSGNNNTGIGASSFKVLTEGYYNSGIGVGVFRYLVTGNSNTGVGYRAGYNSKAVGNSLNTFIGSQSGFGHATLNLGAANVFIGALTGLAIQDANYNILIGYSTGSTLTTGDYNLLIGYNLETDLATDSYSFKLGRDGVILLEGSMSTGVEWIGSAYEARFDEINEYTAGSGVTIEGVEIKDNNVNIPDDFYVRWGTGTVNIRGLENISGTDYLRFALDNVTAVEFNSTENYFDNGGITIRGHGYPFSAYVDNDNLRWTNSLYSNTASHASYFYSYRYGGTKAVPTAVPTDADIVFFRALAYDGTTSLEVSRIEQRLVGSISTGSASGDIGFMTRETTGSLVEVMTLKESGTIYMYSLGDNDSEDHVIAINDSTGLLTKRSIDSIITGASYWDRITGTPNYLHPATTADELHIDVINEYTADAGVTVEGVHIEDYVITLPVTTGKLAFGDGDTYIYEPQDDFLYFVVGGVVGAGYTSSGMFMSAGNTGDAFLSNAAVSPLTPPFTFVGDINTGIGRAGADQLSLIAGGNEIVRVGSTAMQVDEINELTVGAGVTIEGIKLEDNQINTGYCASGYHYLAYSEGVTLTQQNSVRSATAGHSDRWLSLRYGAGGIAAPTSAGITTFRGQAYDGTTLLDVGMFYIEVAGAVATDNLEGQIIWGLRPAGTGQSMSYPVLFNSSGVHPNGSIYTLGQSGKVWNQLWVGTIDFNDTNTQIWEDGSSNLTFKDAVTGTKTLAELAAVGGDVSWGTATNKYLVYGSASGDIESDSGLLWNTTSHLLGIDGGATDGGELQLRYNNVIGINLKSAGTYNYIEGTSPFYIRPTGTSRYMGFGISANASVFLYVKDPNTTPLTSVFKIVSNANAVLLEVKEAGTVEVGDTLKVDEINEYTTDAGITISSNVYLTDIDVDETEAYLVAIDNTTGLLSKRLVSGIGGSSYTFDSGLTETTGNVDLGGALTSSVEFTGGGTYSYSVGTTISRINGYVVRAAGILAFDATGAANQINFSINSSGKSFVMANAQMSISDSDDSVGLQYSADYSTNGKNVALGLWIPNWASVKSQIGGNAVDALIITPTATEDGYVVSWNDTNSEYELIAAGGGGVTLSGSTNDTICTVTGTDAIQGEANLKFSASTLITTSATGVKDYHRFTSGSDSGDITWIDDVTFGGVFRMEYAGDIIFEAWVGDKTRLFHATIEKLATTATGVVISGTLNANLGIQVSETKVVYYNTTSKALVYGDPGAGTGDVSYGSGSSTQIAYWGTTSQELEGSADFTYNDTSVLINTGSSDGHLILQQGAGNFDIEFKNSTTIEAWIRGAIGDNYLAMGYGATPGTNPAIYIGTNNHVAIGSTTDSSTAVLHIRDAIDTVMQISAGTTAGDAATQFLQTTSVKGLIGYHYDSTDSGLKFQYGTAFTTTPAIFVGTNNHVCIGGNTNTSVYVLSVEGNFNTDDGSGRVFYSDATNNRFTMEVASDTTVYPIATVGSSTASFPENHGMRIKGGSTTAQVGNYTSLIFYTNNGGYNAYGAVSVKSASATNNAGVFSWWLRNTSGNYFNAMELDSAGNLEIAGDATADDFVLSSDPLLKNVDERPVEGIETVMALNPVYYKWKNNRNKNEYIGFLTTDMKKVRPELVKRSGDYDAISYSRITAINTAAIQDLNNKIEELKNEIKRLKDGGS